MSKSGPKPDPNSIQGRLRGYFAANPGEALTYEDAAVKLDVPVLSIRYAMRELSKRGELTTMTVICLR